MRLGYCVVMAVVSTLFATVGAHAETIAEVTGGTGVINHDTFAGQSFLVLGGGKYTDITFNFYSEAESPYAIGKAYLFLSAYTGTPAALSSADPGFLGSAVASGDVYSFGSSLTLAAGDTYYLYEDTLIPEGTISGGPQTSNEFYETFSANDDFGSAGSTSNFLATGSPIVGAVPTPEPPSLIMLGTGLAGLVELKRRFCAR
jgi:hypothetical protein